jgi:cytochrome c553
MMKAFGILWACVLSIASIAANATDMAERTKACEACHGDQGRAGPDGFYPRLAGKPAGYLYNQMQNFSEDRRHYSMMRRMMAPLTPQYQKEMADYFAALQVPYPAPSNKNANPSTAQMARGRQLALQGDPARNLPACNTCHGESLMGFQPNVPGLLGLPTAYLGAQLSAWKLGERTTKAPDCMSAVVKRLSPEDAAAVVSWLAAQEIPTYTKTNKPPMLTQDFRCASAPELHGAMK